MALRARDDVRAVRPNRTEPAPPAGRSSAPASGSAHRDTTEQAHECPGTPLVHRGSREFTFLHGHRPDHHDQPGRAGPSHCRRSSTPLLSARRFRGSAASCSPAAEISKTSRKSRSGVRSLLRVNVRHLVRARPRDIVSRRWRQIELPVLETTVAAPTFSVYIGGSRYRDCPLRTPERFRNSAGTPPTRNNPCAEQG